MLADGWFSADELAQYALPSPRLHGARPKIDWNYI
jgi:hypothetical protein